jgi:hypothetical protein
MCKKEKSKGLAVAALLLSISQIAAARADDTPACVAKMSEYVAELDQLLATEIPWYRSHKIGPYRKLNRTHFPFADCDGDPLLIEASKSRFFRTIGYQPRPKSYIVDFSNGVVLVSFIYRANERRAESNGLGWVDK